MQLQNLSNFAVLINASSILAQDFKIILIKTLNSIKNKRNIDMVVIRKASKLYNSHFRKVKTKVGSFLRVPIWSPV